VNAAREPQLSTEQRLLPALAELLRREPLFHRREIIGGRADFKAETAEDYWEVGASGRRYSREYVWAVLEQRYASPVPDEYESCQWGISDALLREVAPGTYLLTYTLDQAGRLTRRLTVWQGRPGAGWKALFHQGTIVEPPQPSDPTP
jgi:hypothetical protein